MDRMDGGAALLAVCACDWCKQRVQMWPQLCTPLTAAACFSSTPAAALQRRVTVSETVWTAASRPRWQAVASSASPLSTAALLCCAACSAVAMDSSAALLAARSCMVRDERRTLSWRRRAARASCSVPRRYSPLAPVLRAAGRCNLLACATPLRARACYGYQLRCAPQRRSPLRPLAPVSRQPACATPLVVCIRS